jgi:hypothetical protein
LALARAEGPDRGQTAQFVHRARVAGVGRRGQRDARFVVAPRREQRLPELVLEPRDIGIGAHRVLARRERDGRIDFVRQLPRTDALQIERAGGGAIAGVEIRLHRNCDDGIVHAVQP